jgi:hypothetical protein
MLTSNAVHNHDRHHKPTADDAYLPLALSLSRRPKPSSWGYHSCRQHKLSLRNGYSFSLLHPMLDLEPWVRFRWKLHPRIAVGDTKYGTLVNIVGLEQDGMRAYLAVPDPSVRTKLYGQERFQYDAERDGYICPHGQFLPLSSFDRYQQAFIYRTSPKICNACPLKPECTTSRYGRMVRRSLVQDYLDRIRTYRTTPAYQKALRKRSVWIEPLFGEAKQWHQLVQFRLRRLTKVNSQALLIAAGQNIKRLLKSRRDPKPLPPAQAAALAIPVPLLAVFFRSNTNLCHTAPQFGALLRLSLPSIMFFQHAVLTTHNLS